MIIINELPVLLFVFAIFLSTAATDGRTVRESVERVLLADDVVCIYDVDCNHGICRSINATSSVCQW
jgi:hypothetical protein